MLKLKVEIKNNTDSTIQIVKILDGSDYSRRYPYAYFKVEKIGDTTYRQHKHSVCGNKDCINLTDFVELKSSDSCDIYNQSLPYDVTFTDANNFKKGKYKIIFYYSTNEYDFKRWMGDSSWMWLDKTTKKLKEDRKEEYEKLLALFAKVPKVSIVSNELIIEIK